MVRAFRKRIKRTFAISKEQGEDFCQDKEREVGRWKMRSRNVVEKKIYIRRVDTHTITETIVRDIWKSFREWAPRMSEIKRTLLLNTLSNIQNIR